MEDPLELQGSRRAVIGYRAPYIPDLESLEALTVSGSPIGDVFGQQIAFLRAFAAPSEGIPALQLRFSCRPEEPRSIELNLLAAADGTRAVGRLAQRIALGVSPGLPLESLSRSALESEMSLLMADTLTSDRYAEITRSWQLLDPTLPQSAENQVLVPWGWTADSMVHALGALRAQPGHAWLIVHIEQASVAAGISEYLQRAIFAARKMTVDDPENPAYRRADATLRSMFLRLTRAALHMRVVVVASERLVSGLPEFVGADLTRTWSDEMPLSFDVRRPTSSSDIGAAQRLLNELLAPGKRELDIAASDEEVSEMLPHLFDPQQAHVAFRVPVAPKAGISGMVSIRAPAFGVGLELRRNREGEIPVGRTSSGAPFGLSKGELAQHVFVAGVPGSGKSTTVQSILGCLWSDHGVPFTVIDPAKTDYRGLIAGLGEEARCIAFGPNSTPINPLAVPEGVAVGTYASRLAAAFEAAAPFSKEFAIGPLLLRSAILATYRDAGFATGAISQRGFKWPTVRDLYQVSASRLRAGYGGSRDFGSLLAAFLGRFEMLLGGTMGDALAGAGEAAVDWPDLLARPTSIELRGFAGADERSFAFALLLAQLISYRECHPVGLLGHVTVIEEAHRILRREPSGETLAARSFSDAIAELRSVGEGFIVVEQAPSLIVPAVAKNTGTRIAHRILDAEERAIVGDSMLLDDAQNLDLGRLGTGRAIALSPSQVDPVLLHIPPLPASFAPIEPQLHLPGTEGQATQRLWCVLCEARCLARHVQRLGPQVAATAGPSTLELVQTAESLVREVPANRRKVSTYCAAGAAAAERFAGDEIEFGRAVEEIAQYVGTLRIEQEATHA